MRTLTRQAGITIVELMIGLAIIGIMLTYVVPSAQTILLQNRIVAEINEISAIVQFARHHAIDEQVDTIMCPSKNFTQCTTDWDDPKMVFADLDGNGQRGGNEEILVGNSAVSPANNLTGPGVTLRFQPSGAVNSPATLKLCHKDHAAKYARALTISLQGRVRMSQDSNNDGIHEDNSGTALVCS